MQCPRTLTIYLALWSVIGAGLCWVRCQLLGQLGSDLLEARALWLSSKWLLILQHASLGLLTWGKEASRRASRSMQSLSKPRMGMGTSRLLPHAVYQSKSQGRLTFKRSVKRLFLAKKSCKVTLPSGLDKGRELICVHFSTDNWQQGCWDLISIRTPCILTPLADYTLKQITLNPNRSFCNSRMVLHWKKPHKYEAFRNPNVSLLH